MSLATNDADRSSYLHCPTSTPFNSLTIPQCLARQAAAHAQSEAYVCRSTGMPRQSINFGDLHAQTDHLASSLIKLGLPRGSKVILTGVSSLDWVMSEIAALKAGLISVRLSLALNVSSAAAITRIINYNSAVAILYAPGDYGEHQAHLEKSFPEFKAAGKTGVVKSDRLPTLKHFISMRREPSENNFTMGNLLKIQHNPHSLPPRQPEGDDIATVTYTSGSDGTPKAVPHSHFNWVNFYTRVFTSMGVKEEDRFYNDRAMAWFDSFVHLPLVTGVALVCVRSETTVAKQHAALQFRLLQEEKCTCGLLLPYFLQDLVDVAATTRNPQPLEWALLWGDVVHKETLVKASSFIKRFEIAYGSVEVMMASHLSWSAGDAALADMKLGCVGGPVQGVEIKVVNNGNRKMPRGGYGDICVRSPFAFSLYHYSSEGMPRYIDGWVKTGDYGYTSKEGALHILARKNLLIPRPIAMCCPAVVEEVMLKHPEVNKVAVFGTKSDRQNIDEVCACVARKEGSNLSAEDLQTFCHDPKASLLSPEVVPAHILFSESFPNMNGKVDKKTLRIWAMDKIKQRQKAKK